VAILVKDLGLIYFAMYARCALLMRLQA